MAVVARYHVARYVGPSAASGPLNGATSAIVSVEPLGADDPLVMLELLVAQPVRPRASARASPAVANFMVPSVLREWSELPRRSGAPAPVAGSPLLGDDAVADGADALDGDLDDVTRMHPDRRGPGEPDSAGGAGGDHVTAAGRALSGHRGRAARAGLG